MPYYSHHKELAGSVVSKAKHALGLKEQKPINKGRCTKGYWIKTIRVVGGQYGLGEKTRQIAIDWYRDYYRPLLV